MHISSSQQLVVPGDYASVIMYLTEKPMNIIQLSQIIQYSKKHLMKILKKLNNKTTKLIEMDENEV